MNSTLIIVCSILVSAFFSGIEIAFISSNKLLIELRNKQGSLSARLLSPFVNNPSRFISTTLVGNNIGLVIYGIYMGKFLNPYIIQYIPATEQSTLLLLFLQTLLSTIVVLVTAEFLPKVLFRINPDIILSVLIYPFLLAYYLFWPIVNFITWLSKFILNSVFKLRFSESTPVFSKVDLDQYITESVEDLNEDADVDTEMFKNALEFANVKLRDCITPRTELISIDIDASVEELEKKFIESELSKIVVHQGSIDHIIGYVHQKDLFKKPHSIRSILLPIEIAPETMSANELLNKFTLNRKSIALVVDELGVTAGIVTIEDIMEEIFGEIEDEHDVNKHTEVKLNDNEFIFNARLEVDYLNSKYELNIPEGEYNTLGGFIFAEHESIPAKGDVIIIANFEFTILSISNNRINELRMKIILPETH
ncbi:MAG: HlyC/CorC family transporter [Bacteroidia bacterium]|nr:HlyC/CorC family transporter [Bacteroidia bacterium]MCC7533359.1 HlyC/CorC family transporter [Bacteroidia bacterium]MCZ2140345.1 hemolysin family protein [Bacteroidia bacterium]